MNRDRSRRTALKVPLVLGALALVSFAGQETSRADSAPAISGYSALGEVLLDKNGCSSCPAVYATSRRHRTFVLASDSPFPVHQVGRVDVTCANGSTYHVFLNSTVRAGPFQLVANNCVNLDSKEIKLTITSVGLAPQDAERTVTVFTYGSFG
jgi:hypothetical protein